MSAAELTPPVTLGELVASLGGDLLGAPELTVHRIAPLDAADPGCISFLAHAKYAAQLQTTRATCVIVSPAAQDQASARGAAIVTPDPYLYFARLTQWWAARVRAQPAASVHPTAVVDPSAVLGRGVSVGPLAVIEAGAVLGDGVVVGPHCVIGERARLGDGTRLAARVTIGFDCVLGQRCFIQSGAVIGADGFGFAPHQKTWVKIEQLGAVRLGDDVEVGANTCIDRGALGDTVIEQGVKLDNLIQIAHNVHIGEHSAMAACAGVAGSARIGKHCTVGGAGNVLGHLTLADNVHISAVSVVTRSIHQSGHYTGFFPLDDNASWEKNAATLKNLSALRDRLRALEKSWPKND